MVLKYKDFDLQFINISHWNITGLAKNEDTFETMVEVADDGGFLIYCTIQCHEFVCKQIWNELKSINNTQDFEDDVTELLSDYFAVYESLTNAEEYENDTQLSFELVSMSEPKELYPDQTLSGSIPESDFIWILRAWAH